MTRASRHRPGALPLRQYAFVNRSGRAHATKVLSVDELQELHAPADLAVDRPSVQYIDVLAALSVGVSIAKIVDVSVSLRFVDILDETSQLLIEVRQVRRLIVGIELKHATSCIRKQEEAFTVVGVGNAFHHHGEKGSRTQRHCS